MIRLHRDAGLQTLENKALSRGIIEKSAPILAEITIRKSQEIIFSLKHYWRFVDSEVFELKALSWGVDEKAA
jgi:hypothetical protein